MRPKFIETLFESQVSELRFMGACTRRWDRVLREVCRKSREVMLASAEKVDSCFLVPKE